MARNLFVATVCLTLPWLAGCESVSRFGSGIDPRSSATAAPSGNSQAAISATPTPPVTSAPLPPPPPRFTPSQPSVPGAGIPASGASVPAVSGSPSISGGTSLGAPAAGLTNPGLANPLPGGVSAPAAGDLTPGAGSKIAAATPPAAAAKKQTLSAPIPAPEPEAAPEKPSSSRLTGGWSVVQGSGAKCRLVLSNSPALDLYKAQTSGCAAGLTKVNAWELRGDEIYLYEQGGGVAARLKQAGNQKFNGATTKSGAPVSIAK